MRGNSPIAFRIEKIPFWFRSVKVDIVKSNLANFAIEEKDSPSLKKEPPPMCSILD